MKYSSVNSKIVIFDKFKDNYDLNNLQERK
jgi:hypothetical protein